MTDIVTLDNRKKRLDSISKAASVIQDFGLVKVLTATEGQRARVRAALNGFLWSCLASAFPQKTFALAEDMLKTYEADILNLPNITPNGLVLPKSENILSFNILQRESVTAFAALGLGNEIARIQYPVNIRLQSGTPDPVADSRPRSSVKPHSDIWAGDPGAGILVFLSVLGDTAKSGIDFFEPKRFPVSFIRPLNDYSEGRPVIDEGMTKLTSFHENGWFLVDPYLIHQTTKKAPGFRISLDFRFIPKQKAEFDSDEEEIRKPYFISFAEWNSLGSGKLLMTSESMHEKKEKTPFIQGYPVKITLIDTGIHDKQHQKRAG